MRILFRWIILGVIAAGILSFAAVAIPRDFVSSNTVHFWAVDGLGAYHYYYDFQKESLYLDEQWNPNAQIAPNGDVAVVLKRGIRTVFIEYIDEEGTKEALGEYPVDIIDLEANWSLDSKMIYMAGRSESGISVYGFDIAARELTTIVEYEDIPADNFAFFYDPYENFVSVIFINFTASNIFNFYKLDTGEEWTIEVDSFIVPMEGWKEYFALASVQGEDDSVARQELQHISLVDDTEEILPLPDEGEVISISFFSDEKHLLVVTFDPDASYILDLETESYTEISGELALAVFQYSPDETMALALDYRYYRSGGTGIAPWYSLDLETYEVRHLFDRYDFDVIRNPTTMAWSPDNQFLAVLENDFRTSADIEILSLETGELTHRFRIPKNRLAPVSSNFGRIVEWYQP